MIRVQNLARSVHFYVDQIGAMLDWRNDEAGIAQVVYEDARVLLASPVADLSERLHSLEAPASPGGAVFLDGGPADQLDTLRDGLVARGVENVAMIERRWGDRILNVPDPDGYTVSFWTTVERTPEATLALYEAGPDVLEEALAGLSAQDLDRSGEPGAWSIRQLVHHIVDSEATVLGRTRFALAEPGRVYHGNPYNQDTWATGLDYAGRDIAPAVALFRAIRGHIAQLMRHLPDAWERYSVSPEGQHFSAGQMIPMLVSHAFEHIEEIREAREVHGV